MASFSPLPAANFTPLLASICTASPVRGLRPSRAERSETEKPRSVVTILDRLSPFDVLELPVMDGMAHPADAGVRRQAGVLRFIPSA